MEDDLKILKVGYLSNHFSVPINQDFKGNLECGSAQHSLFLNLLQLLHVTLKLKVLCL